ncbi:MAG: dihydrolipoyl dehydrogenase [Bradymonadaceae bacterium]|nr:dihydrolipoyl dehydrogenase [Lujinxingiaceae bacterium]
MASIHCDVAVIGAGTAGMSAHRVAQRAGKKALLIEAGDYGTTCAREACMPSKLLIEAANRAHDVARAGAFGIEVPAGTRINAQAVLERVRSERDRFVGSVLDQIAGIPKELHLRARARFVGPNTLELDDGRTVEARAIVVAAGSSAWLPDSVKAVADRLMRSEDVFNLEQFPASLAIFGPGVVGLELGQALQRLGTRVSFFSPLAELGNVSDALIRDVVLDVLGESMAFRLDCARLEALPAADGGVCVRWCGPDGQAKEQHFERLLVTTGRRPAIAALGFEHTGLALADNGVPLFDHHTMQCGTSSIFLAGDVSGEHMVLHEAADEGRIAGDNAVRYPEVRGHLRRTPLSIVFTDPQMAVVGRRFVDLNPDQIEWGESSYDNQGRARIMGKNAGKVRVYASRETGCLLGAELFAPGAEHTAHLLAWAVQAKLSAFEALQKSFYHPVLEEGIRSALRNLSDRLHLTPDIANFGLRYGPGA